MISSHDQQEALADIFAYVQVVDEQIFGVILEIVQKEKVQDIIGYLSDSGNLRHLEQKIFEVENNWWKLDFVTSCFKKFTNILRLIQDHDFNKIGYATKENQESIQDLRVMEITLLQHSIAF